MGNDFGTLKEEVKQLSVKEQAALAYSLLQGLGDVATEVTKP